MSQHPLSGVRGKPPDFDPRHDGLTIDPPGPEARLRHDVREGSAPHPDRAEAGGEANRSGQRIQERRLVVAVPGPELECLHGRLHGLDVLDICDVAYLVTDKTL